jgi:hypothetical protein
MAAGNAGSGLRKEVLQEITLSALLVSTNEDSRAISVLIPSFISCCHIPAPRLPRSTPTNYLGVLMRVRDTNVWAGTKLWLGGTSCRLVGNVCYRHGDLFSSNSAPPG